jgi:hypothetical protein
VTLEGRVSDATGTCPSRTFTVDRRTVRTTSETKITGGNCSELKNKAKVEVRGVASGGVVMASSVTIAEKAGKDDDEENGSGGGRSAIP